MPKKAYARRYAQAVFEMALEKKELEKWQTDLESIAASVDNADFLAILENPKVKVNDKTKMLSGILKDVNPMALNLVNLLVTKASIGIAGEISLEYNRLLDSYHGVEQAEVITAVPLDDKDQQKLTENLSNMVGKKVVLNTKVDPEIIGGIIARVGGKLMDGSTRSKLTALKRQLVGAGGKS